MSVTILLVDSDLIDRADWQALLQFHGYRVHAARSGKAALDCFRRLSPDLVLMDSALSDISSNEMCRRLKADAQNGDTPIIVVGSHLSRLTHWHAPHENPGDCSTNPATRTEALDRIQTMFSGGQFHLFSELPEHAEACPGCNRDLIRESSAQFDG